MSLLANAVLPTYHERDRQTRLDNRFRLEFVAQRYADAARTIAELRGLSNDGYPPQAAARDAQYEILSRAEERSRRDRISLADAFGAEFRALVRPLDNRTSALVMRLFNGSSTGGLSLLIDRAALQRDLDRALAAQKGKTTIALVDALALIRAYQIEESYRLFMPFAATLVNEDDNRRYIIEKDVRVPTPDGATVCAQIVRPRISERLPALLEFTNAGEGTPAKRKVAITQRELSQMIGRSRESTNKQLRAWAKRGWIRLERGGLTVLAPDKLTAAAAAGSELDPS